MLSVILQSLRMILFFCSKCEWACDLWQQLDFASELEFDLQDSIDWGRKCAFDFNAGKIELVLFDWSHNYGYIASLSLLCRYYFVRYSSGLAELVPLSRSRGVSTCYFNSLHDFLVTIPICYKDVYINSFFLRTSIPYNCLPAEYFLFAFDLLGFNS